jgi:hypothetical protein
MSMKEFLGKIAKKMRPGGPARPGGTVGGR